MSTDFSESDSALCWVPAMIFMFSLAGSSIFFSLHLISHNMFPFSFLTVHVSLYLYVYLSILPIRFSFTLYHLAFNLVHSCILYVRCLSITKTMHCCVSHRWFVSSFTHGVQKALEWRLWSSRTNLFNMLATWPRTEPQINF